MVRIEIYLDPLGDKSKARKLAEAHIINDGGGTPEHGNYIVKMLNGFGMVYKQGVFKGWPRLKHKMALHELIYLCFGAVVGNRAVKIYEQDSKHETE